MPPDEDTFRTVDSMLDQLMVKHFEMAQMVGEYREMLDEVAERPWDADARRLVRSLPGARYHVTTTYVREQVLKIEAELKRMFPEE